ncbi:MAG: hypothetical protein CCU26_18885 [Nitrospira sp. UW-LDO-01]|nr:MAG: hypothetical protein CCU26_18885 [Nitrospira sp. UW-LDO-01]
MFLSPSIPTGKGNYLNNEPFQYQFFTFLNRRPCGFNPYPLIHDPAALAWREGQDRNQIKLANLVNFFDKTGLLQ